MIKYICSGVFADVFVKLLLGHHWLNYILFYFASPVFPHEQLTAIVFDKFVDFFCIGNVTFGNDHCGFILHPVFYDCVGGFNAVLS